jgi:hypothetical protein
MTGKSARTLRKIAFMNEAGDDVGVLEVANRECVREGLALKGGHNAQVVVWAINVRWDRGSKVRAELLLVRVVRDIDETLRMRIPEVALVRRAKVDLVLAQRRFDPVGEHARRETRDDFLHARDVRRVQHVIVDVDIVAQHRQLILHIHEQPPDCTHAKSISVTPL